MSNKDKRKGYENFVNNDDPKILQKGSSTPQVGKNFSKITDRNAALENTAKVENYLFDLESKLKEIKINKKFPSYEIPERLYLTMSNTTIQDAVRNLNTTDCDKVKKIAKRNWGTEFDKDRRIEKLQQSWLLYGYVGKLGLDSQKSAYEQRYISAENDCKSSLASETTRLNNLFKQKDFWVNYAQKENTLSNQDVKRVYYLDVAIACINYDDAAREYLNESRLYRGASFGKPENWQKNLDDAKKRLKNARSDLLQLLSFSGLKPDCKSEHLLTADMRKWCGMRGQLRHAYDLATEIEGTGLPEFADYAFRYVVHDWAKSQIGAIKRTIKDLAEKRGQGGEGKTYRDIGFNKSEWDDMCGAIVESCSPEIPLDVAKVEKQHDLIVGMHTQLKLVAKFIDKRAELYTTLSNIPADWVKQFEHQGGWQGVQKLKKVVELCHLYLGDSEKKSLPEMEYSRDLQFSITQNQVMPIINDQANKMSAKLQYQSHDTKAKFVEDFEKVTTLVEELVSYQWH